MNRAHHLLLALATGTYSGGPLDDDDPHAIIRPGVDVTIWAVDGNPTSTHSFSVMVAPGRRVLTLRVEHSMEDETPQPHSRQRYVLQTEDGVAYHLERREGTIGEIDVTTSRFR